MGTPEDDVKVVQDALHDLPASHPCAGPAVRALSRLADRVRELEQENFELSRYGPKED